VKITRPIAAILVVLIPVDVVVCAGLFVASYAIDTVPGSMAWRTLPRFGIYHMGLVTLSLLSFTIWLVIARLRKPEKEPFVKEFIEQNGGVLKTLLSPSRQAALRRRRYPTVPSYLWYLGLVGFPGITILIVCDRAFGWGIFGSSMGGILRFTTAFAAQFCLMFFPILYAEWRELSQPVITDPTPIFQIRCKNCA
jgi:hypothetical protein